jgi:hypothetical protein
MIALLDRLAGHCADWVNPIVLKETRQLVRSRYVVTMLMLLLTVLFVACAIFVLNVGGSRHTYFRGLGRELFYIEYTILTLFTVSVPLYAGFRLAFERDTNVDLLYVTSVRPAAVIRGKLLAGMVFIGLLLCAALPFMVFNFSLRGIDIPTVVKSLAILFVFAGMVTQGALFLGAVPCSRIFKMILAVGAVITTLYGGLAMVAGRVFYAMSRGYSGGGFAAHDWLPVALALILPLLLTGTLYVLTVALIAPASANRALPVRVWLTFLWLVTAAGAGALFELTGDNDFWEMWLVFSLFALAVSVLFTLGAPVRPSHRIRRQVPRNRLLRILVFPFFSGIPNGLAWAAMLAAPTLAAPLWLPALHAKKSWRFDEDVLWGSLGFTLYLAAYGLLALLLQRKLLGKWFPRHLVWVLSVMVAAVFSILPLVVTFIVDGAGFHRLKWELGCPLAVFDSRQIFVHATFAAILLAVFLLVNIRHVCAGITAFAPPVPAADGGAPEDTAGA